MKKTIGVFIGEISQEYQRIISQNIAKKANELGYSVIFMCSYGNYNDDFLYQEGEKACIHLPNCEMFDGIIVTEDVFDIDGMPEELYEVLKETAKCPVVYMRTYRPEFYSVQPDNQDSIESMVRHFTQEHGFRDICFMTGKKESKDSIERLNGYLNVMRECGISVNEHMYFYGDYWRHRGKEAVDWFMEGRTEYPQAIVCANDYMALSICEELNKRGVRVPEDVCVSGFDYVDEAKANIPTLTSLEVDFKGMAVRAVEIIDNCNRGLKEEHIHNIKAKLCVNGSCGCGGQHIFTNVKELIAKENHNIDVVKNLLMLVSEFQEAFQYEEYMKVAYRYRWLLRTDEAYFCFIDTEDDEVNAVENDSKYTKLMNLRGIFKDNTLNTSANIKFPRNKILPDEIWSEDKPDNFFLFTIHFKNKIHGYIASRMPKENAWFNIYTQGYLMTLANAIENSEIHNKMQDLEKIRTLYQNDALTGILNRRGFDKKMHERFKIVESEGKHIGIASIDMDNLKVINDTYGHSEGDKALVFVAKALSSVMKEGDFCARVGGDEFAAVINIAYPGRCTEFKQEFRKALTEVSNSSTLYNVGASIGICETSEHDATTLMSCVRIADARMYEDKREHKKIDK